VSAAALVELTENWAVLGSLVYDMRNDQPVSHSMGLAYSDECFDLSAIYSETPDPYSDLVSERQVFLRFNFRTLGGSSITSHLDSRVD
jgi:LPS-assembly protein